VVASFMVAAVRAVFSLFIFISLASRNAHTPGAF
jgi:hypothetical protein